MTLCRIVRTEIVVHVIVDAIVHVMRPLTLKAGVSAAENGVGNLEIRLLEKLLLPIISPERRVEET